MDSDLGSICARTVHCDMVGRAKNKKRAVDSKSWSWEVNVSRNIVCPSPAYVHRVGSWYSEYREDDPVLRFKFPFGSDTPDEFVHKSRLAFQGGPFAALVSRNFAEKNQNEVLLCAGDDPLTFRVIRNFLYCKNIYLANLSLDEIIRAIRSAHRWELIALFKVLCRYIAMADKIDEREDYHDILRTVDIASLPNIPQKFRIYFWECVTSHFDKFTPAEATDQSEEGKWEDGDSSDNDDDSSSSGEDVLKQVLRSRKGAREPGAKSTESDIASLRSLPIEERLNPLFPNLWELALAHEVVDYVLQEIVDHGKKSEEDLMELVLHYLEPRMGNDSDVANLIAMLDVDYQYVLKRWVVYSKCSVRAIRLYVLVLLEEKR